MLFFPFESVASICLRLFLFSLVGFRKELIYHYWIFPLFFSGGLNQMEGCVWVVRQKEID